ncbi:ABC transporter permease [Kaistia dalseonensis]|uniref:NitT/TauT family transport system permease protein n=1 Tax=Kaistia dalseonensis TaxID=410840 RepID=A0ABU0HAH4_9HYPH|nr:ABC transporter permease [Kaistia dalseonensis]MCX5496688.1 ABC transporter permease [Kaistia dalseonensis]MDQ0439313.1 NitT/TauT family transport system permease protein [Kaistia dalseonensis]
MASRLSFLRSALPVAAALIGLLLLWQLGAMLFDVPTYILPRPGAIVATAIEKAGLLGSGLWITSVEAVLGFFVGTLIGLAAAVLMILAPPLEVALIPLVIVINSVPSIAFVPLVLIWFGLGIGSKVAIGALAVSFVVLLNALAGLKRPEADAINLMRSFGASRLGILWRLQLPAAMPSIVTGLRVGLARSTIAVIVAEMMGAYAGIGQIIYQSTAQVDYLTVWAAVFVASLGSLVLYGVLVAIDRKLVWWR